MVNKYDIFSFLARYIYLNLPCSFFIKSLTMFHEPTRLLAKKNELHHGLVWSDRFLKPYYGYPFWSGRRWECRTSPYAYIGAVSTARISCVLFQLGDVFLGFFKKLVHFSRCRSRSATRFSRRKQNGRRIMSISGQACLLTTTGVHSS